MLKEFFSYFTYIRILNFGQISEGKQKGTYTWLMYGLQNAAASGKKKVLYLYNKIITKKMTFFKAY